jgi:hypothetical protein
MNETCEKLSQMNNVQEMWDLFSTTVREAINISVPKETVKIKRENQSPWFNRKAEKLHQKQQTLYKKCKDTGILISLRNTNNKGV